MKKIYIVICASVIISIFAVSMWLMAQEPFSALPPIDETQKYILHEQELIPWESATSFLLADGKIYIYYDANGLVNIYLMDGSFDYGIQIPTIKSGKGDIAFHDGHLYIESRRAIYYVFNHQELVETIVPSDDVEKFVSQSKLFDQEKNHWDGDCRYQLSPLSADIVSWDDGRILVDLPEKSELARSLLILGSGLLGISMLIYEKLIRRS